MTKEGHTEAFHWLCSIYILIWVAGELVFALLFFKLHSYMLHIFLHILQQKEINLAHFHRTFGNKILYWYHLMSETVLNVYIV